MLTTLQKERKGIKGPFQTNKLKTTKLLDSFKIMKISCSIKVLILNQTLR